MRNRHELMAAASNACGVTAIEYALIAALLGLTSAAGFTLIAGKLALIFATTTDALRPGGFRVLP